MPVHSSTHREPTIMKYRIYKVKYDIVFAEHMSILPKGALLKVVEDFGTYITFTSRHTPTREHWFCGKGLLTPVAFAVGCSTVSKNDESEVPDIQS